MLVIKNQNNRVRINIGSIRKALISYLSCRRDLGPVDITFVTDREIARLAGKFRGSPYSTDVLSFTYGEEDIAGEVAVSLDTAKRQAGRRRVSLEDEILLLCVHGLLHIEGFDDESFADFCKMKKAEFETMMRIL